MRAQSSPWSCHRSETTRRNWLAIGAAGRHVAECETVSYSLGECDAGSVRHGDALGRSHDSERPPEKLRFLWRAYRRFATQELDFTSSLERECDVNEPSKSQPYDSRWPLGAFVEVNLAQTTERLFRCCICRSMGDRGGSANSTQIPCIEIRRS